MRRVSLAEAKDKLPSLVSAAQHGEAITITRHGKPVAELRAVTAGSKAVSPRSIAWIAAQLSDLPRPRHDAVSTVRALRDDEP